MDIEIRAALPGELDGAGELAAAVYLEDGLLGLGERDPYLASLRDARGRAAHGEVLIAADPAAAPGADPLGTVTFAPPGGSLAEVSRGLSEAEFRMLAVSPAARGRGVGEALVRACLSRARSLGCARVVISSQSRMHTAHRLYQRLGFVREPERDWEPLPGVALHVFALDLSPQRAEGHNI